MSDTTAAGIAEGGKCQWCGMIHGKVCPAVKAFEYHPDGTMKRVEFFSPGDLVGPYIAYPWPAKPLEPYCGAAIPDGPANMRGCAAVVDLTADPRFTAAAPAYFGAWHETVFATASRPS